jgi:hypothetical protein
MDELTNTTEPQIAYSECYVLPFFSFYNADNMVIMKTFKDKEFDLAIFNPLRKVCISVALGSLCWCFSSIVLTVSCIGITID